MSRMQKTHDQSEKIGSQKCNTTGKEHFKIVVVHFSASVCTQG